MKHAVRRALVGALFLSACGVATASAAPLHTQFPGHFAQPPTTAQCEATKGIACYGPTQYQQAYNMNPLYSSGLTGKGKTIVIVDSFGSPTIQSDLTTFDQAYGLPAPPSLKVIAPEGPIPPFDSSAGSVQSNWGVETSLDVEYAHAMAPGANILLVETPVAETEGTVGLPQMMDAEKYVIDHHMGDVITQSFGATEETFPSPRSIYGLRYAYQDALAHRVTVLGASGDAGPTDYTSAPDEADLYPFRVNSWPSSDPLVTSVGGTQLHLDADGNRTAPDNAWNDTALLGGPAAGGGGLSAVFSRPSYQNSVGSTVDGRRGTPDVSMSAAVNGGANVYWSFQGQGTPGWHIVGGTSEASPLFSGVVAVADQAAGRDLGLINPTLYAGGDGQRSGLLDVAAGNTTVAFTNPATDPYPGPHTVLGYTGVPGYDLATGLGTANGAKLVSELAGQGAHKRGHRSPHGRR